MTELVSSQKEDILQRVELILQARQRHRKVAPLALAGVMALLLVCSYSVVVQPAYYPSMEEITEGQYTPVTTWNSWLARESRRGLHPLLQGGGAHPGQRQDSRHHAGPGLSPAPVKE